RGKCRQSAAFVLRVKMSLRNFVLDKCYSIIKINLCKKRHQTQLRPSDRYDIIFFREIEERER
ncbi:MAG: hypothetical protein PUF59_05730, partial [Lachnospiraceae bacterium]|nr:hypothetical protein [Lachnospiraceae bacterium]